MEYVKKKEHSPNKPLVVNASLTNKVHITRSLASELELCLQAFINMIGRSSLPEFQGALNHLWTGL